MSTILIADTDPTDRRVYINLLGNFGHRLLEAADGSQALELTRAELPDLIIADIGLPNMDGFALMSSLHAEPLLKRIPIIFHTDRYDESEIHRQARAGGVAYILRKPAEPQEILRVVNECLKQPAIPARLSQTGELQHQDLQLLVDKLYQKIEELERVNERLRNLSLTDGMTSLNNRRGFMILGTGLLKFARRAGYSACLLYIDMDSLKYLNDTFGHTVGDTVLTHFSEILTETFRDSDVIGRMGGDEFVVLLIDATESDLASMQARLQNNVNAYNLRSEQGYTLSFSLGVIRIEANSTITMEELLSQADMAMAAHKQSRRKSK
jgi:diguanylate cyclase (GGDEF)-like protein